MKPKEINNLIQEQTQDYFKEEGFRFVKKEMGYIKRDKTASVRYGFTYLDYHPIYDYDIALYISINEVEDIYKKLWDISPKELIPTYVFPLSYFLNPNNYINNNPTYEIQDEEDISVFSQELIVNYEKYVKEFISHITQPENMLEFLLDEIATGKDYVAKNRNVLIRTLILMKLLNKKGIEEKLVEFKQNLVDYRDDIKAEVYKQMEAIVSGDF